MHVMDFTKKRSVYVSVACVEAIRSASTFSSTMLLNKKASAEKVRIANTRSRAGMYLLVHLPRYSNKSASPEHIIFSRTYCEICDCLSYRLGNIRYAGKHGVQSSSRTVGIGRKLLLYEINQIITVSDKARTHIMAFS